MDDKTMQRLELEMAVHTLIQNMDVIIENQQVVAKIRKATFDALVKEGFKEEQALHIVSTTQLIG